MPPEPAFHIINMLYCCSKTRVSINIIIIITILLLPSQNSRMALLQPALARQGHLAARSYFGNRSCPELLHLLEVSDCLSTCLSADAQRLQIFAVDSVSGSGLTSIVHLGIAASGLLTRR